MMDLTDLNERLTVARKRCEIAQMLILTNRRELIPTELEDLFYGVQGIVEDFSVEGEQ